MKTSRVCYGRAQHLKKGAVNLVILTKAVIALVLLLWIAASLSSVFWRLFPAPELAHVVASTNASAFAPVDAQSVGNIDINTLKSIALFGKESIGDIIPVAQESIAIKAQVEKTSLNLKLVGSFASDNKDLGYAIIAKGKDQDVYRVGDELIGLSNVKLIGVYSEKVILNNKGRQEALYMFPEGESITGVAISTPEPPRQSSRTPLVIIGDDSINFTPKARLQSISDAIRFSRKTKDGQLLGFRVLPGRNRKAFEQTELKLNDVVTAIDGQVLDNLKTANAVYQEKKSATQASLTVLRGEQELTINVDLNNINLN